MEPLPMRHFPKPSGCRTFYSDVTIELTGAPGCGSNFDVEVEFTAERDTFDPSVGQGDAGERIIVSVRAIANDIEYGFGFDGVRKVIRKRAYREIPDWMLPYVKDCIDLDALEVDWSE
jgi:hypothetical protein